VTTRETDWTGLTRWLEGIEAMFSASLKSSPKFAVDFFDPINDE